MNNNFCGYGDDMMLQQDLIIRTTSNYSVGMEIVLRDSS